jgi:hypothetical protein
MVPGFQSIFITMQQAVMAMINAFNKATGVINISLAILQWVWIVVGLSYIIRVFWETEGDGYPAMAKNLILRNARVFWVSILVMNGMSLTTAFRGVALAHAKGSIAVFASLQAVAADADGWLWKIGGAFDTFPKIAARGMDIRTSWITQDEIAAAVKSPGNVALTGKVLSTIQDEQTKATAQQAADQARLNKLTPQSAGYSAVQAQVALDNKRVQAAQTASNKAQTVGSQLQTTLQAAEQGWWQKLNDKLAGNDGTLAVVSSLLGSATTMAAVSTATGGLGAPVAASLGVVGTITKLIDFFYAVPAYLVGYAAGLIFIVGIVILGVTIIKESFGIMTYIAGFIATIWVGAAIAIPLAPLFFMSFVSDKWESYGRTYVGFWMSMIFASAGLQAMCNLVGLLITAVKQPIGVKVAAGYADFATATTGGGMLAAALYCAAGLVAIGMCLSFVLDLVKRGASVGAAIWSGSFPT